MRNSPDIIQTLHLAVNNLVLVQCKKKLQTGPYYLLSLKGDTCIIKLLSGPTNFHSIVIKPYCQDCYTVINKNLNSSTKYSNYNNDYQPDLQLQPQLKRSYGRPPGSKNKPK